MQLSNADLTAAIAMGISSSISGQGVPPSSSARSAKLYMRPGRTSFLSAYDSVRDPEISNPRSRLRRPVDARRCGAQSDQRSVGVLTPGRGTRTIIIGSAIAVHAPSPAATSPVLPPSSPPGREIRGFHAPGPGESSAATEGWAGGGSAWEPPSRSFLRDVVAGRVALPLAHRDPCGRAGRSAGTSYELRLQDPSQLR